MYCKPDDIIVDMTCKRTGTKEWVSWLDVKKWCFVKIKANGYEFNKEKRGKRQMRGEKERSLPRYIWVLIIFCKSLLNKSLI